MLPSAAANANQVKGNMCKRFAGIEQNPAAMRTLNR